MWYLLFLQVWKASLKSLQLNVIIRHYTVANIKFMWILGKNKNDYLYANFANVLIICWYLPASNFSSTMLYCIRPEFLLKVIYLPRLDFKPVNFLRVCCLLIDASSSWFLRWCNQNLRKPLAWVNVLYGWPFYPFPPRIFGMFSKIAVFFGSNLFCDSKTKCVFSEIDWFLPTLHEF